MSEKAGTPGWYLAMELKEQGINAMQLAKITGIKNQLIYDIKNNKRRITAKTAALFGMVFKRDFTSWIGIQATQDVSNDLKEAERLIREGLHVNVT